VNEQRQVRVLSSRSIERGEQVEQASRGTWFRLTLVLLGLFGAAFAISGLLIDLPRPAIGGTCGSGTYSETAIVALLDPGSIGAGAEPPASKTTDRAKWMAFVAECQAATDSRALGALVVLAVSLGVGLGGTVLLLRMRKRPVASAPSGVFSPLPPPISPFVSQ
jgi:hypothetical protein